MTVCISVSTADMIESHKVQMPQHQFTYLGTWLDGHVCGVCGLERTQYYDVFADEALCTKCHYDRRLVTWTSET